MVLASGWPVNLPRRSSIPFQKFSHGFPCIFHSYIAFAVQFPILFCDAPCLFPCAFSLLLLSFLHDSRLSLAFLRIPLSKNAKRAQAAACAAKKKLPPRPGRSVLDGRASAGTPLDHRPVGRPMIRRQRRTPRSGWPTSRRYEPRQRGANPPEIPARLGQKWASPSPGLDSPRQVSYTTPQKTFAWIFPDEDQLLPFSPTALSAVWRFRLPGRRAIFPLGGSLL